MECRVCLVWCGTGTGTGTGTGIGTGTLSRALYSPLARLALEKWLRLAFGLYSKCRALNSISLSLARSNLMYFPSYKQFSPHVCLSVSLCCTVVVCVGVVPFPFPFPFDTPSASPCTVPHYHTIPNHTISYTPSPERQGTGASHLPSVRNQCPPESIPPTSQACHSTTPTPRRV